MTASTESPFLLFTELRGVTSTARTTLPEGGGIPKGDSVEAVDRKSTRLNSSHTVISYAVFCLKKKKNEKHEESVQHEHPAPVPVPLTQTKHVRSAAELKVSGASDNTCEPTNSALPLTQELSGV